MDNLGYKEEGEGGGGVNDDVDDYGNAFYNMFKRFLKNYNSSFYYSPRDKLSKITCALVILRSRGNIDL